MKATLGSPSLFPTIKIRVHAKPVISSERADSYITMSEILDQGEGNPVYVVLTAEGNTMPEITRITGFSGFCVPSGTVRTATKIVSERVISVPHVMRVGLH